MSQQYKQYSLSLCLWRSLIFDQRGTKDIEDGVNSQCSACSFAWFIIQNPYARKTLINRKPYKAENMSKIYWFSEFCSEEVTELLEYIKLDLESDRCLEKLVIVNVLSL